MISLKSSALASFVLAMMIALAACKNKKGDSASNLPDSTVYSIINYTHLLIDSTVVNSLLENWKTNDSIKTQVLQFYKRRNYQYAWFNEKGLTGAASLFNDQLQNFKLDFEDKSFENRHTDSLFSLALNKPKVLNKQKKERETLEMFLTTTFFKYADKAWSGTDKNTLDLEWFIPRKKKNYQVLIDSLISTNSKKNFKEPVNQYYTSLIQKLRVYRRIQKKGGFPRVSTDKKRIENPDSDSCLIQLKLYLTITGDLKLNDGSIFFTDSLEAAIRNFQNRMGLTVDGKLGNQTLVEINQPIAFRINQIMINLERLRWIPNEMEPDYLLVNIPEFKLHVFEKSKLAWSTPVVVGKSATKTSIFKGDLAHVVLNPYWNIPSSIARNEILPRLKQNPGYLARNKMEVLQGNKVINPYSINWSQYGNNLPFTFRQKPSKSNALGKMKFLFPNNYSIYLHDTPSKSHFTQSSRAFSHGCIRVENPKKLANYLIQNIAGWDAARVDKILETEKETYIKLSPTIPVYIAYFTAWVDSRGQLNFRNDLYHLDDKISDEVFAKQLSVR